MDITINGRVITVQAHPLTDCYAADLDGNVYRREWLRTGVKRGGTPERGDWVRVKPFAVRSPYTPPYLRFSMTVDKHRTLKTVHRFVLECFHGLRDKRTVVRHLNDVFDDNRLANLSYGTINENVKDAFRNNGNYAEGERNGRAKLTSEDVLAIRSRKAAGETAKAIARDYPHVNPASIKNAAHGVTWAHLTAQQVDLRV